MESLSVEDFFSLSDFEHRDLFNGCQFVWEVLHRLDEYLKNQQLGVIVPSIPSTVHLVNPSLISIGSGTVVEPGAYIQGPCIIGKKCTIRHGAYVRGHVITGDECVIGHDTEIKHSILLNQVQAAHFNYVGDSILGNRVNLGAGSKCANLRLDRSLVNLYLDGEKIATRLQKLGLIAGDGAQVGCNCVTNPGTFLGKESICYPCVNVGGFVPSKAKVKCPHPNLVEV